MIPNKILPYLTDGTIVFFRDKGVIGKLICGAQSIYTKHEFGVKSLWSHIGIIIGDYFYESTVKFNKKKKIYGCVKRTLKERFDHKSLKKHYSVLGFQQNLPLSSENWELIFDKVNYLINNDIKYGGQELFGTLFRILRWRFAKKSKKEALLQKANKFDSSNVYCVAFVADAIEACGKEYIDVHHSISTVDEAWYDCKLTCNNKIIKV